MLENLMRSERYSYSRAKTKFRTEEISIRGFVRDLKSKLLDGQVFSLEEPEYCLVAEAFDLRTSRLDISLLAEFYNEEEKEYQIGFVDSSCYSKWWNGHQYPGQKNQKLIEILFPGLLCKWFGRANFRDRLQLHLASLDLFSFSDNCNCKEKTDVMSFCQKCLYQAIEEAKLILEAIHSDWKPEPTRYLNLFDICISGPKQRAGFNVWKNHAGASVSDARENIDFDLSLEESSYIGVQVPKEIADLYQDENALSVVQFIFTLVGLNLRAESEYRDDLILDFMTALNCAGFYLSVKHGIAYTPTVAFFDEKLQEMLIHSSEYFYDEPVDINVALAEYEMLTKQTVLNRESPQSSITYPMTLFDCHSGFKLTELFFELISFATKGDDVKTYLEHIKVICHSDNEQQSRVDDYLEQPFLRVFKAFEAARFRYLNLFKITGYCQKELINELSKTVQNPVGKKTMPSATSHKNTIYSNKINTF